MDKFYKYKSKPLNFTMPILRRSCHEHCTICDRETIGYGITKCYDCVRPSDDFYENYSNDQDTWWIGRYWNKDGIISKAHYLQTKNCLLNYFSKEIVIIQLNYLFDFGSNQSKNMYKNKLPKNSLDLAPKRILLHNIQSAKTINWLIWKNKRNRLQQQIINILQNLNFVESKSYIVIDFLFENETISEENFSN